MNFFKKLFGGSSDENENYDEENYGDNDENDGEEPFIKPYDFYIEADDRHNAEKTFETNSPQSVDIIRKLEEMDLAFDIINHSGIRRKLKRLYSDLAFEISDFVSYQGGRSADSFDTEEIDDIEYEIYVDISKKDDDSPFEVTIKISGNTE